MGTALVVFIDTTGKTPYNLNISKYKKVKGDDNVN